MNGPDRVRTFLAAKGKTQEWLAEQLGVSPAFVSQILSGVRTPSLAVASRLEALTKVPAKEFAPGAGLGE